jgi:hypothetical protein
MTESRSTPNVIVTAVVVLFAAVAIFGVAFGLTSGRFRRDNTVRIVGPPQCVGRSEDGQFDVETNDVPYAAIIEANEGRGVVVRREANAKSDYDVLGRLLPANCLVGFVGFCIGQGLEDLSNRAGPYDQQWFVLPDDRGVVHGGVVQELPPGTIGKEPMECPGSEPAPEMIELTSTVPQQVTAPIVLEFDAPDAINVGAAALSVASDGSLSWRSLGIDDTLGDGFAIEWDPSEEAGMDGVTVVYAVCWAGNVPGAADGHFAVDVPGLDGASQTAVEEPDAQELREGAATACYAPSGGS